MSRLMTINKIDLTTQINNQTQMTLQVISTQKRERKKKQKKKRRRKETGGPKLMQIIPEKEQQGQITPSENKAVNENSASLMVNQDKNAILNQNLEIQ